MGWLVNLRFYWRLLRLLRLLRQSSGLFVGVGKEVTCAFHAPLLGPEPPILWVFCVFVNMLAALGSTLAFRVGNERVLNV